MAVRVCVCVTNIGGGLPEASHLMTRSSTLKMVTDSGCVVIAGGILTARKQTKIKFFKKMGDVFLRLHKRQSSIL